MGDMQLYTKEQVIQIVEKSRATGLTAEYLLLSKGNDEHIETDVEKVTEADYIKLLEKTITTLKGASSQTEISDEEIVKGAKEWYEKEGIVNYKAEIRAWVSACKWYREQLKQRQ